jgi:putative membrane protein
MMWNYGYEGPVAGYGGYDGYSIFHLLGHIFWIVILVAVIVMAIRWMRQGKHSSWHRYCGNSALDVLRERYARGEIEKPEYEDRKKVLSE